MLKIWFGSVSVSLKTNSEANITPTSSLQQEQTLPALCNIQVSWRQMWVSDQVTENASIPYLFLKAGCISC